MAKKADELQDEPQIDSVDMTDPPEFEESDIAAAVEVPEVVEPERGLADRLAEDIDKLRRAVSYHDPAELSLLMLAMLPAGAKKNARVLIMDWRAWQVYAVYDGKAWDIEATR